MGRNVIVDYPLAVNILTGEHYPHIRPIINILHKEYPECRNKSDLQLKQKLFLLLVKRRNVVVIGNIALADGKAYAANNTTSVVNFY